MHVASVARRDNLYDNATNAQKMLMFESRGEHRRPQSLDYPQSSRARPWQRGVKAGNSVIPAASVHDHQNTIPPILDDIFRCPFFLVAYSSIALAALGCSLESCQPQMSSSYRPQPSIRSQAMSSSTAQLV